jgi:GNAT superfamily N-acetyltransferase
MKISEIQITPDDTEPWDASGRVPEKKSMSGLKLVPGSDRYAYSAKAESGHTFTGTDKNIFIYDTKTESGEIKFIGYLGLRKRSDFPSPKAFQVSNVAIDSAYRGQGIGQLLYSVPLRELGYTLIADDTQTGAAMKLWVNLSKDPNVSVNGYITYDPEEAREPETKVFLTRKLKATKMGTRSYISYYSFPVSENVELKRLQAAVKKIKIYSKEHPEDQEQIVGLYARWANQEGI